MIQFISEFKKSLQETQDWRSEFESVVNVTTKRGRLNANALDCQIWIDDEFCSLKATWTCVRRRPAYANSSAC